MGEVRREQLPANEQRANVDLEGETPQETVAFTGGFVESGDSQTTGRDVSGNLQCPECDNTYKTERGLENHLADKHVEQEDEDADADAMVNEGAPADEDED